MSDIPENGHCFKCGACCDSDAYCYGCEEFICDGPDCGDAVAWSLASAIGHGHDPDDHFIEAGEGDEGDL